MYLGTTKRGHAKGQKAIPYKESSVAIWFQIDLVIFNELSLQDLQGYLANQATLFMIHKPIVTLMCICAGM